MKIELLTKENFNNNSLDSFNRTHKVTKCYRKIDGEYKLVDNPYTEKWDLETRRSVAKSISSDDYITYIALQEGIVVGFIDLIKELVGNRIILDMMYVSSQCRRSGIGKALFEMGVKTAQDAGAKEMYISACSSEETIAFYRAMGAEITDNPIKQMAENEPYDLQMTRKV